MGQKKPQETLEMCMKGCKQCRSATAPETTRGSWLLHGRFLWGGAGRKQPAGGGMNEGEAQKERLRGEERQGKIYFLEWVHGGVFLGIHSGMQ